MSKLTNIEAMVREIDPENAEYILTNNRFNDKVESAKRFEAKNEQSIVNHIIEEIKEYAKEYNDRYLTPANVKVGDGVTMHLWSDAHAGTVVKVTKTSVTVQRDIATLDPSWKPEFIVGGFAGHCTNQSTQKYNYETNPNGELTTFRWSKVYQQYRISKTGLSLSKGRHEFYDYNF